MRVLLTNDDGIEAAGLHRMRRELLTISGLELIVIAPDSDRSAIGRGITFRRSVRVERRTFDHGPDGYATSGTPVDCVRLADLGFAGDQPVDLVVSGINHGANMGDDITYSGTVAAALEGIVLGIPAIAVSQERTFGREPNGNDPFGAAARFVSRMVSQLAGVPIEVGTMLNVNVPVTPPTGVEITKLGRRIYFDRLEPTGEIADDGSGEYVLYNAAPGFHDEPDTDVAAVAAGRIAVTPLHLDLTLHDSIAGLSEARLERMLDDGE